MYQEHFDEAAMLYEQRVEYLHDLELTWREVDAWDQRFEAHLDALVVGEALALTTINEYIDNEDAGQVFAAMKLYCRIHRMQLAFDLIRQVDHSDADCCNALCAAMKLEMPTSWKDHLLQLNKKDDEKYVQLVLSVFGFRRFSISALNFGNIEDSEQGVSQAMAWALGRIGGASAAKKLHELLSSPFYDVRRAASIALLRLGDDRPVKHGMLAAQSDNWPRMALGIAGNKQCVNIFLDIVQGNRVDADAILGLGLLGDLRAVAPLLKLLDNDDFCESASIALNTITGAGLSAEVFVAEEFDEDELFDDELESYRKDGSLPKRHDGSPFGSWEVRPLREQATWRQWLDSNRQRFSRDKRWRHGMPYGPRALIASIKDESTPNVIREAAYDELTARYAMAIPFEYDLSLIQQDSIIGKMDAWAQSVEQNFVPGQWYFAGESQ